MRQTMRVLTTRLPKTPEASFLRSVHQGGEFPSVGPEVALAGRSNVGKSSFLNALVGARKPFARTSRTPGRTRSVNYYRIQGVAFVDLPGFGWAKVPREERNRWKTVVESYLAREEVKLVLLMLDVRRGVTNADRMMVEWAAHARRRLLVVVTKVDKAGRNAARGAVRDVAATLAVDEASVLAVSAAKKTGLKEAWRAIGDILAAPVDAGRDRETLATRSSTSIRPSLRSTSAS